MISDFSTELWYWIPLLLTVAAASWLFRARALDFSFVIILVLSQYVLHALISFGPLHPISVFCTAFFVLFLAAAKVPTRPLFRLTSLRCFRQTRTFGDRWFLVCRTYLITYFIARLIAYPFFSGELVLDERLFAQQENPLLFVLGLATPPALAGCMFVWMTEPTRLRAFDKLVILLVALGLFGAGSKSAIAPLVLTYIGVASYLNRSAFADKTALLALATAVGLTLYALNSFFPELAFSDIASLVQYRVVANTDSLEYIYVNGVDPREFPYAGVGALLPLVAKRLGYEFEFPPGVWMHGLRFGDWSGFGPNAGIVLDYFGNLGWFGLAVAPLIGLLVRRRRGRSGVVHCSFLAIAPTLVIDIGIFDINLVIWGSVALLLIAVRRIRFGTIRIATPPRRQTRERLPSAALGAAAGG